MPCCSHFSGRIGPAAEIDEITVVGGGIFGVFRMVLFAIEHFVFHIFFRNGFCDLFRKNIRKPKDEKSKTKDYENEGKFFLHHWSPSL